jgi:hypothetical protein
LPRRETDSQLEHDAVCAAIAHAAIHQAGSAGFGFAGLMGFPVIRYSRLMEAAGRHYFRKCLSGILSHLEVINLEMIRNKNEKHGWQRQIHV